MSTGNSSDQAERKRADVEAPPVPFCHRCRDSASSLPHHGLCPHHTDFYNSGSYEILNLVVDGCILGLRRVRASIRSGTAQQGPAPRERVQEDEETQRRWRRWHEEEEGSRETQLRALDNGGNSNEDQRHADQARGVQAAVRALVDAPGPSGVDRRQLPGALQGGDPRLRGRSDVAGHKRQRR